MADHNVDVRFGARTAELDAAFADMAAAAREATSQIRSDLAKLASETKEKEEKVKDSAKGMAGAFATMRANISSAVSGVSGVLSGLYRNIFSVHTAIVGLVGGGIVATVKSALESAAAIRDTGNAANATTRYIQEMRYAAAQNGAAAATMDDALVKLNKNLGEFRNTGAGPAAQALKQLGLEAAVMSGEFGRTDEAMDAVLSRLHAIESDADRAALAADLFGKSAGPKLAELMKLGTDGIQAAREEARRLGLVLSDEMIAKADDADDKLNALWETMKIQGVQAIVSNADAIKKLAEEFAAAMPGIIEWLKEAAKWWGILDRTPQEIASRALPGLEEKVERLKRLRAVWAAEGRTTEMADSPIAQEIRALEAEISKAHAALAASGFAQFEKDRNGPIGRPTPVEPPKTPTTNTGLGSGSEDPEVAAARSAAQQRIQIDRDTELQRLSIWQQAIEQRHTLGTLSDQNYLMQAAVIVASETAIKRKAIEDQLALEGLKPAQRQQLQAQLEQLELDHQARMAQIGFEAERIKAEARQREIEAERQKNELIARDRERLASEGEQLTNRLLSQSLTSQNILMTLAQQAQDFIVKLLWQQISAAVMGEQAKTTAAATGAAARSGIAAGESKGVLGAQMMKALKSIATAAAETFANVYAYFSPFMGPFAAIPAGVAAAAVGAARLLIPSARGGTEVMRDGLHFLHEKEVVLPANWTRRLGALADNVQTKPAAASYPSIPDTGDGESGAGGGFGRRIYQFNVSAIDAAGVRDFFRRNGAELGEAMHRSVSDGHFKPA